SKVLGLDKDLVHGKLNLDADIHDNPREHRGKLHLALTDAVIGSVSGVSLRLDAELEGDRMRGATSIQVKSTGSLGSTWDTRVSGLITRGETWRSMVGTAQAQLAGLQLSNLAARLPGKKLEGLGGAGFGQVRIARENPKVLPDVFFVLSTQG